MKTNERVAATFLCLAIPLMLVISGFVGSVHDSDAIDVRIAEYTSSTSLLRVEATSSKDGVQLEVYRTADDKRIGVLDENKEGKYEGEFSVDACPDRITVKSTGGGRAVADVEKK